MNNLCRKKAFLSKVEAIKDDVFKMETIKNATQFSRSILNIVDYVQLKYNNEVGDSIEK